MSIARNCVCTCRTLVENWLPNIIQLQSNPISESSPGNLSFLSNPTMTVTLLWTVFRTAIKPSPCVPDQKQHQKQLWRCSIQLRTKQRPEAVPGRGSNPEAKQGIDGQRPRISSVNLKEVLFWFYYSYNRNWWIGNVYCKKRLKSFWSSIFFLQNNLWNNKSKIVCFIVVIRNVRMEVLYKGITCNIYRCFSH